MNQRRAFTKPSRCPEFNMAQSHCSSSCSQEPRRPFTMSLDPQLITPSRCDHDDDTTSSVFSSQHPPSTPVDRDSSDTIPPIFQRKRKDRKSFVWLPENGEEYNEKGKWRWRCRRCSNLRSVTTFS